MPQAFAREAKPLTVSTSFKETVIEDGFYNIDGNIYLPLVEVSEALGSVVYKYPEYKNYYIISRDGDVISHSMYYDSYELNGEAVTGQIPSTHDEKYEVLVPLAMIERIYGVTAEQYGSGAIIKKEMTSNYYNKLISGLMQYCIYGDFYPENFKRYYSYYAKNPSMDPGVVINSVNIGLDKKWFDDAKVVSDADSKTVLVNKLNRLPDNFEAKNLEKVDRLYAGGSGYYLDREAYYNYVDMYDAAAKEGLRLKIVSAYRTESYQRNLYNSYVRRNGKAYAEKYSAHPGYSEHQTGLAVDINSVYTSFEKSKEYAWLKKHAHEYGFIERYQKGKEYITGYSYEPWHYRYVGKQSAEIIHSSNITYEEYCAVYLYKSVYKHDKDRTWVNVISYYHI